MQVINDLGNVLETEILSQDDKEKAKQIEGALKRYGTSHLVIGEMPKRGDLVKINGLSYTVLSCSKKGNLHLELIKNNV